uniref:Pericentrin-like isoform X2 n=1 Tax=Phascolarctos cinereus TaxID=38626 RepID=A0A6P5JP88_PHACI|nr:pericentrin-like isoform X2 [Phascolarctos cinereus]XP_020835990.1 pericentrin-like isoform X2 [Phascolarctos cinereus]XP_020835991.1 pericentrin-like isoform X2 [Phascolarctos cinereus]XP_020835992.1 pericentrin-like isoform X2 [Phascolarctos cinereus]
MMDQLEKDKGFEPRAWQKHGAGEALPPALEKLQGHHSQLENLRQQLLHVSGLLSSFMNQTLNRTINDWTSSDQKAAMSLLFTLEELKSELMSGLTQYKSMDHIGPLPEAEKAVWRQEKMASQGMRHSKSGMVKAAFKSESSQGGSTSLYRMEKSYLHFLPAESSLKALIYQNSQRKSLLVINPIGQMTPLRRSKQKKSSAFEA